MPDYFDADGVSLTELRRHSVGTQPPKRNLAMARVGSDRTVRIVKSELGTSFWPYSVFWTPNGSRALFSVASRAHTEFRILAADPKAGKASSCYSENSMPWFAYVKCAPSCCSQFVYVLTYRSGWRQIWRARIDGAEETCVTSDKFDFLDFEVALKTPEIFATAFASDPLNSSVLRVSHSGKEDVLFSKPGMYRASPNDDGESLAVVHSSVGAPPKLHRTDGPKHALILDAGTRLANVQSAPNLEWVKFELPDGKTVRGKMFLPRQFSEARKYPVVFTSVYANQGKNAFSRYHPLDAYMADELGYVVIAVDLRGSVGYGADFFFGYRDKLGIIDAWELSECARQAREWSFIDSERIGLWGGSYGGFLVLMTMSQYPGLFHSGIAWKSVTEWRNYFEWYTSQRLGLPKSSKGTFDQTSPLTHIANLQGNLLIVAGMRDDNVLFHDTLLVIEKLIEHGKYFDLMIYPQDDHMLDRRHESLPDLMERIASFFEQKMGTGPIS
jgi:dipeptidyl-peptidase-4